MFSFKSLFLPFCSSCNLKFAFKESLCESCLEKFKFKKAFELKTYSYFYEYRNEFKELILNFKKNGNKALGKFFAMQMLSNFDFSKYDTVISIPCSFKRQIYYGFDHIEHIGKILKKNGVNYINLLKRKYSQSQKTLKGQSRKQNLKNKINVKLRYRNKNLGKVLIIDDILTTGSSLHACVEALKGSKLSKIEALFISKVIGKSFGKIN